MRNNVHVEVQIHCHLTEIDSQKFLLGISNYPIYIYIYCHPQKDCFVVLQLFSVVRHVGCLKLGSKPTQLYIRFSTRPLGQQAYNVSLGIIDVKFICKNFIKGKRRQD